MRTLKVFKPLFWLALFFASAVLFLGGFMSFCLVDLPHMAAFRLTGALAAVLRILAFDREGRSSLALRSPELARLCVTISLSSCE